MVTFGIVECELNDAHLIFIRRVFIGRLYIGQVRRALRNVDAALGALTGMEGQVTARRGIAPKPTMSAAARRKISIAQKARWAKVKAGK